MIVKSYLINLNLGQRFSFLRTVLLFILAISSLLTISVNSAHALNASTANVIHGSAPYLSFDNWNRAYTTEPLLWMRFSNGAVYQPYNDYSNMANPIVLPDSILKVGDVQTIIPAYNYPSISLSNIIASNNYFNDFDGDGEVNSTGSLTVTWRDVYNNDITDWVKHNQDAYFSSVNGPYQITISSTNGYLWTRYGLPQAGEVSNFQGASHTYYILPVSRARALRAQGLNMGMPYDVSPDTTENFPTTGGDGLAYHLYLRDISPEEVIAINGATVHAVEGEGVYLTLSADRNKLEITLHGPIIVKSKKHKVKPRLEGGNFSPSTFVLYADRSHSKVLYQFELKDWFLNYGPVLSTGPGTYGSKCYYFEGYWLAQENNLSTFYQDGGWGQTTMRLGYFFNEWGSRGGTWNLEQPTVTASGSVVVGGMIRPLTDDNPNVLCVKKRRMIHRP